ncbi:Scarecrow-like protein 32 [Acorus gramineus]|uniref:Scarecrow-like protein 32 n=1 Tax=Acorus gramineus TaxID=55184 RepID=A0AAV9AUL8_ACOGR|nr:Scarecrow-like protein 32 [Acorus gramineus]
MNGLGLYLNLPMTNPTTRHPWPGYPHPTTTSDTNSMEQLLIHCATAIDGNDATLAQQILWVLNNIAPPDGDSTQRLTSAFLRGLISRASRLNILSSSSSSLAVTTTHRFPILDLASFIDLTPWHRFGFSASNAAILDAVQTYPVVHVLDLSVTRCMQIPTLIDAFASRAEGPPYLKLTILEPLLDAPPTIELSYEELGLRLVSFARSRNVAMEFRVVPSSPSDGFVSLIEHMQQQQRLQSESEALVVNCQMMLHYVAEGEGHYSSSSSLRSDFLKSMRRLEPTLVTLVDEDADFTSDGLIGRLRAAFNYLWIPYDAVDTFLPRGSERRRWYEAEIGWRVENVVAQEGVGRVERLESRGRWAQRMRAAGFKAVGFGEEAVAEVRGLLEEHAAGWGLKKEEEEHLVLTWKGHNVVFATVWVPSSIHE